MAEGAEIAIVPANEASWADLRAVFGTRAATSTCLRQRFRIRGQEKLIGLGRDALIALIVY
jgi:hypothetical protein